MAKMTKDEFVVTWVIDQCRRKRKIPVRPKPRTGTYQNQQVQYSTKGVKCQDV